LPSDLTLTVAARYASASFDDAANTVALGGYTLLDLRASYAVGHGLELYGRVQNATDRHYETVYQYGQPGREGFVGVRKSF
jgi:vitamin B12 transporter